jgi:hypothetical protein
MKPFWSRRIAAAALAAGIVLAASFPPLAARPRGFPVMLHLRHPDGSEETIKVENFRFVYYNRRFIHRPKGFGKPGEFETRDLPEEARSVQDEDLSKVKFSKIRRLVFEYRDESGKRLLHLVMTRTSKRRAPVDWPAYFLRNANTSLLPHFRGLVGGTSTDFPLPPLQEPQTFNGPVLTAIDFKVPGEKPGL